MLKTSTAWKPEPKIERIELITKWLASLCLENGHIVSTQEIRDAFNEDIKQAAKNILKFAK